MEIDGPLVIDIIDDASTGSRKVEVKFRLEFQILSAEQQSVRMKNYIQPLYRFAQNLDPQSADYQGIQLILPLCEQVLPYLAEQSIDLGETITMELDSEPESSRQTIDFAKLALN